MILCHLLLNFCNVSIFGMCHLWPSNIKKKLIFRKIYLNILTFIFLYSSHQFHKEIVITYPIEKFSKVAWGYNFKNQEKKNY